MSTTPRCSGVLMTSVPGARRVAGIFMFGFCGARVLALVGRGRGHDARRRSSGPPNRRRRGAFLQGLRCATGTCSWGFDAVLRGVARVRRSLSSNLAAVRPIL